MTHLVRKLARAQFDRFFNLNDIGDREKVWLMQKDGWIADAKFAISVVKPEVLREAEPVIHNHVPIIRQVRALSDLRSLAEAGGDDD